MCPRSKLWLAPRRLLTSQVSIAHVAKQKLRSHSHARLLLTMCTQAWAEPGQIARIQTATFQLMSEAKLDGS
jgi:hypothetical protein